MINRLKELSTKAYAPYSNFNVVALFEKKDGSFFYGVNIENAAYPNSMCAERVGLYSAINNNEDLSNVIAIHVFSPNSNDYLSPCGGCRQTLSEHISDETAIKMYSKKGDYIEKKFSQLFPFTISKINIKGEN